ncbi:MAG: hypothetical protein P8181_11660 [bacterium]
MQTVPADRIVTVNRGDINAAGAYVLYWMIASRRVGWNFAFQRAVEWSRELDKPLLVLEALRCGHRWASDRMHRFVIDGMADNARRLRDTPVRHYPYVETEVDAGKICQIGFMVADKQEGCFRLEIKWVCAYRASPFSSRYGRRGCGSSRGADGDRRFERHPAAARRG